MFDQLIESTSMRRDTKTWIYFAGSSLFWSAVLAAVAIAGIFAYDARLDADFDRLGNSLVAQVPSPPPPPPPPGPVTRAEATPSPAFVASASQPREIAPPAPAPPVLPPGGTGGLDGGSADGRAGGEAGGDPASVVATGAPSRAAGPRVTPPPPEPPDPPVTRAERQPRTAPVRVSGRVLTGKAVRRVEPKYPEIAKVTNVSGDVVVEIVVSEEGRVVSARAVSGHPLLRDASVAAARGWAFSPTTLSEIPVKVVGTITFSFRR